MMVINKFFLFVGLLAIASCTKDFGDINTNPNAPIDANPNLLLRRVLYDYGEQMSYEGFTAGNLLSQHFTMVDFNLFDRHSLTDPQLGGNPWPVIYSNLRDNEILLQKSRENIAFSVYEGPALILKSYMAAALTDIYGDVPYSEALQGAQGNIAPAYDPQETIYTGPDGILANLDKAIALLQNYTGAQAIGGDILFNGSRSAWVAFANSLKIKYLMRISGKKNVSEALQAIYDEGKYLKTNAQNAVFSFTDGAPNNFRMATLRAGDFNLYVMSQTAEEIFKGLNDPRIGVFYRPVGNDATQTQYKGLLNGPNAAATSITVANFSLTGRIFRENTARIKANFMTAWETQLLLAEAAEKGLLSADAKSLYDSGVSLAFEFWQTPLPADYLSNEAAYGRNGSNKIEQIIVQKWIANTINGYEGWIEFRRTGFPRLKTVQASLNNNLYPLRMPYPTDEAALNNANFSEAAAKTGNNSVNTAVWWDVN